MSANRVLRTFLLVLACLWSGALSAQQADTCLRRTLLVEVTDQKGNPVLDLKPDDFGAEVRGKRAHVIAATPQAGIRRMVILLDTSGSMRGEPSEFLTALRVAAGLVGLAPPQTRVALMTFSDKIEILGDFTATRQAMVDQLRKMDQAATSHGRTRIRDAVVEALGMLGPTGPEDALFVITDGGDNASHTDGTQLEKLIGGAGIRLFPLTVGEYPAFGTTYFDSPEAEGVRQLHRLQVLSGGLGAQFDSSLGKDSAEVADTVVAPLLAQANDAYRLELELPEPLKKPSHWKLQVVNLPAGAKRPQLAYPDELLPCPSAWASNKKEK
ncbi:MAG TPA: VWA domain-containing protein [Terriglobales bacterium]|nr:VWA domain-containing protein [Terriglobales bacterium]